MYLRELVLWKLSINRISPVLFSHISLLLHLNMRKKKYTYASLWYPREILYRKTHYDTLLLFGIHFFHRMLLFLSLFPLSAFRKKSTLKTKTITCSLFSLFFTDSCSVLNSNIFLLPKCKALMKKINESSLNLCTIYEFFKIVVTQFRVSKPQA